MPAGDMRRVSIELLVALGQAFGGGSSAEGREL